MGLLSAIVHSYNGKINNVKGESGKGESVMFSLELTVGDYIPLRVPLTLRVFPYSILAFSF